MDVQEMGRQLQALRKPVTRDCVVCSTTFTKIGHGRYCSKKCRDRANSKAYRARRARAQKPAG